MAFQTVLLNGVTTGTSIAQDCSGVRDLTLYMGGTGTISTGTLIVEEASYNVTGIPNNVIVLPPATWSTVTSNNPLDCTEVTGDKQKAYQLPPGAYHWVRVRIGTTVTGSGGKVFAMLVGI